MDLTTLATIAVICVFLYAVIGDAIRNVLRRLGINPHVFALLWAGPHMLWEGFVWVAYKVIVGREPPHSVKQSADPIPDDVPLIAAIEDQRSAQYPIATPQNTRNEPVVIAPAINELDEVERYLIERLALLVLAEKLTQTDAIKIGLGIAPGSRSPRYQFARAALQAELTRLEAKPELVGEMADRIKREEMTPLR